jgi:hypothetical protein
MTFDHNGGYAGDADAYARVVTSYARLAVERNQGHLGGSVVADLRAWLHTIANGRCCLCGGVTRLDAKPGETDRAEVSHIMSVGDSKRGMSPGNVFNGCRACNLATSDKSLTPYLHLFSDIWSVPVVWETRGHMAAFRTRAPKSDEARKRRESLGFDF